MENKTNLIGYPIVIILTVLITLFVSRCEGPIEEPPFIISNQQAIDYYNLYTPRAELIDSTVVTDGQGNPFKATRYFEISDEYLFDYKKYVQKEAKERGTTINGLRLYYGIYPDDYPRDSMLYAKRQMFFIVPTRAKIGFEGVNEAITIGDDDEILVLDNEFFTLDRPGTGLLKNKPQTASEASLLNFSTTTQNDGNSLIANEIGGSPPRGNQ